MIPLTAYRDRGTGNQRRQQQAALETSTSMPRWPASASPSSSASSARASWSISISERQQQRRRHRDLRPAALPSRAEHPEHRRAQRGSSASCAGSRYRRQVIAFTASPPSSRVPVRVWPSMRASPATSRAAEAAAEEGRYRQHRQAAVVAPADCRLLPSTMTLTTPSAAPPEMPARPGWARDCGTGPAWWLPRRPARCRPAGPAPAAAAARCSTVAAS